MIIAPIIFIIGYSNVIGTQFLLPTGRQKYYTISVCTGTVVNLVFNLLLIPHLLSYGAALATVIAEMSVTLVQIYATRNIFSYKYIFKIIYKYIIAALIMFLGILMLSNILSISILNTFIEIFLGCIIYFLILIILKDKTVSSFLYKVIKKVNL